MTAAYLRGPSTETLDAEPSCAGKTRYASPAEAHAVRLYRKKRDLDVYYCEHCRGWHMGHSDRSLSRLNPPTRL